METKVIDGKMLRTLLWGGAQELRLQTKIINDLNVFPVPDGDTGTNMTKTMESGLARLPENDDCTVGDLAESFAKGTLLGARGNSGVILSQFFAGMCQALSGKTTISVKQLAEAYLAGVERSYQAVATPVEGTMLTVFRESARYAAEQMEPDSSLEDLMRLQLEEAERSLARTKEILPVLREADVVDSGGAGYYCIVSGMYDTLLGKSKPTKSVQSEEKPEEKPNYDLFSADSEMVYGYCTECLVRLQNCKTNPATFDEKSLLKDLEARGCQSIVLLKDNDILKLHAHTMTPGDILSLCQRYGEFLNIKIENMCLQHSEKIAAEEKKTQPRKPYGVVVVATGDGLKALFGSLGADVVIDGGQTSNPSAEAFLKAFDSVNADNILVFPNNSNLLLTAGQAAALYEKAPVTVIPTKTVAQGYAALSVFNPAIRDLAQQTADLLYAKDAVVSGEITVAVRDTHLNGLEVKKGQAIGVLDGTLVCAADTVEDALCRTVGAIEDLDERELVTLFVGQNVSDEERIHARESLQEAFATLEVQVFIGNQDIYSYLIAVE